jgi:hypothetical protein
MHGKYLNAFGEYAERIYAYMEKTQKRLLAYSPYMPRDIKVCITPLIIILLRVEISSEVV